MNPLYPIYTQETECQDCYKCVRHCPVKAIKIESGHAAVMEEMCVLCGKCVNICPMQAKKGRNDKGRAKQLLKRKEKVLVSLAPSYISEFDDQEPESLIAALKSLGFYAVSETAYGAEEVSAHVADLISQSEKSLFISSACPTVVSFIEKYRPELVPNITPVMSPIMAHCKLLRKEYGQDIGIVFISPCLAKKEEADLHPDLLDVALTFSELKEWFEEEGIDPESVEGGSEDSFVPRKIYKGSLYPVDGGMIEGIQANLTKQEAKPFFFAVSGLDEIDKAISDVTKLKDRTSVFLELLACEGGCINGPTVREKGATGLKRYNVLDKSVLPEGAEIQKATVDIVNTYGGRAVKEEGFTENQIQEALEALGKRNEKYHLNCGGCGYDSCRELAKAYLSGRAEKSMCVSYMRWLAHKKANQLLNTMPSGVVIVNRKMEIVECNRNFASLMGDDVLEIFETVGELGNADLTKIAPFHKIFRQALENAEDTISKEVRMAESILQMTVFTIEKHHLVGAIMQDVTDPVVQKQHVIEKAQDVIQKNLETVQKIAFLLGENAAESEVILSSIIEKVKDR